MELLSAALAPAQLMGYGAFAISAGSFFVKRHSLFLWAGAVGACVWGLHFWLLGQQGAAVIEALSALRLTSAVWAGAQSRRTKTLLAAAWTLVLVLTLQASASPVQTGCVAMASAIGVIASFFLEGAGYRKALLAAEVFWFSFFVLSGSIAGIAMSVVAAIVNCYTLVRLSHDPT